MLIAEICIQTSITFIQEFSDSSVIALSIDDGMAADKVYLSTSFFEFFIGLGRKTALFD